MFRVCAALCGLVLAWGGLGACGPSTVETTPGVPDRTLSGSGSGSGWAERAVVTHVVDGDTVVLADDEHVRLIGIDTPERGACGAQQATAALRTLVEGREVELVNPTSVQDQDRYDRLLRYLDVGDTDAGLNLIEAGLATARYDSRDGYDPHPRESLYRRTDRRTPPYC